MEYVYSCRRKLFTLCLVCLFLHRVPAQPVLDFSAIVSGFVNPVDVVPEPGSNRLFVVEQGGTVRIVNGNTVLTTPFMNINSLLNLSIDERGLLSLAFHPNYLSNRYLFVYYTNLAGDITLARYQRDAVNPDIVDPSSGVVLLNIPKPFENHNGGKLNFGADGKLYFGTGDGGSGNDPNQNAQNGNSLLGKMIRLDVDNFTTPPYYSIPSDNPFVGNSGVRDEIYALGLRNPWRWSFDRLTGDMWIADVGQGAWEEVNYCTAANATGVNYGWRCYEGNHVNESVPACTPSGVYVPPIFEYGHNSTTGGFAITGGYVYRGSAYPVLDNYYVCADYVSGNVWLIRPDGSSIRQAGLPGNISTFGEDNNGELLAVSRTAGTLFNVVVSGILPVSLVNFTGYHFNGRNELKWKTGFEENTQKFVVEYSTNGTDYLTAGEVAAAGYNSSGGTYTFTHYINSQGPIRYRLRIVDIDQASRYSPVILIGVTANSDIRVYPTMVSGHILQVMSGPPLEKADLYTIDGKLLYSKAINGESGYISLTLPGVEPGMYLVRLLGKDFQRTERIIIR